MRAKIAERLTPERQFGLTSHRGVLTLRLANERVYSVAVQAPDASSVPITSALLQVRLHSV